MQTIKEFGEAQKVTVTVLVDNTADIIIRSTEKVTYHTGPPLLAEHGFSALIHLHDEDKRILWDAGITRVALLENMKRMSIDPRIIGMIALSHGHLDHIAAVTDILNAVYQPPKAKRWENDVPAEDIQKYVEGKRVPLIVHPAFFRERWRLQKDGIKFGPVSMPARDEWKAAGADIILSSEPYKLGSGCWTTGEVPRESFESSGIPRGMVYRKGVDFLPDYLEEDQAIVLNIKNKGLVILSGCAHSGIINTVNHSRNISGVDKVWAVLGGFHLVAADDEDLQRTINDIMALEPSLIAPSHCTGMRAICEFALQMPDEFSRGIVGASYVF